MLIPRPAANGSSGQQSPAAASLPPSYARALGWHRPVHSRCLALLPPICHQRPCRAIHGISMRQGNPGNVLISLWTLPRFAVAGIPPLAIGIGTHYPKIPAGSEVFVRHAGRNNHHIAMAYGQTNTLLAAELYRGMAAKHPKHFMCGTVIVVHPINTIAPAISPALCRKQVFKQSRRIVGW